jgi:hypothetical protein
MKATYGTGFFALLNTGTDRITSKNRLLTTIGYKIGPEITYALDGSIFAAGAAVQWLRDGLGINYNAGQSADLAATADAQQQVYLVPAFTGLERPGGIRRLTVGDVVVIDNPPAHKADGVRQAIESAGCQFLYPTLQPGLQSNRKGFLETQGPPACESQAHRRSPMGHSLPNRPALRTQRMRQLLQRMRI